MRARHLHSGPARRKRLRGSLIGGVSDERFAGFRAEVRRDWDDAGDVSGALRVNVARPPRSGRCGGGGRGVDWAARAVRSPAEEKRWSEI